MSIYKDTFLYNKRQWSYIGKHQYPFNYKTCSVFPTFSINESLLKNSGKIWSKPYRLALKILLNKDNYIFKKDKIGFITAREYVESHILKHDRCFLNWLNNDAKEKFLKLNL